MSVSVWRIDESPPQERLIQRKKVHRVVEVHVLEFRVEFF